MTVESTTRRPVAPPVTGNDHTVDDAVIAHLRTFFYDSRYVAPLSNIVGTLVFVV